MPSGVNLELRVFFRLGTHDLNLEEDGEWEYGIAKNCDEPDERRLL